MWSPDSKRVAYANRGDKWGEVKVYFWNGTTFDEGSLPEDLPSPDIQLPQGLRCRQKLWRRRDTAKMVKVGRLGAVERLDDALS
jgi:hypothetical protein